jgi:uncharacterized protein YegL
MTDSERFLQTIYHSKLLNQGLDYSLVILLVDRSGSMRQFGMSPMVAVNECITTIKETFAADNAFASVRTFADDVTDDIPIQPLNSMPLLHEYKANGNTALYDAVGDALHMGLEFKNYAETQFSSRVQVAISVITDGLDTCSKSSRNRVMTFSAHAREAKFILQAIGLGVDHRELAELLGFTTNYSHTVEPTASGVRTATKFSTQIFSDLINRSR